VYSKPQKLAAEFWGTFVVVLASVGAVCADEFVRSGRLAAPGLGAAGGAAIGPLGIALAYGLALASMTIAVGHISGGHFNPAISVGFWATRRLSTFDALSYCIAQLGGATVAAYVLRYAIPEATWRAVALGTPEIASGLTRSPAMLIEGLGAFVVTFAVYAATAGGSQTNGNRAGGSRTGDSGAALAGGLALTVSSLFAAPFTGGAFNPARAFGPAAVATRWANHGVYWIGPLAGGVLAAWLCNALFVSPARRLD
jgi:MIP family channel proteins